MRQENFSRNWRREQRNRKLPQTRLTPSASTRTPRKQPGDRIGRYKLLEKVGEGGCGIVYVAEQTEPVRRRVALKVIKLGMDTKAVVARFEAERQALAMMDHPNIAKVLDAGTTDMGRPFFVMELVRGIRITDYCDQANLSTKERLGLFIKVCQAIQHAHQKGIIHRDVKPSNILVTRRTVLQRTNTWKPAFTHHGATLAFASDISSTNSSITLLDLATQQETQFIASIGTVKWLGFTPDDQRLLTVSERTDAGVSSELPYYLTAWDIDTKGPLWQRGIAWAAGDGVNKYRTYAISPDGKAFAAVGNDPPRVRVFEMKDGSERFTITPSDEWATCVTFSPDSSTLLTGAAFTDSTIRLWDAHTGKTNGSLAAHHSFVNDLLFTPDGKQLISSSGDQTIRLWDWSTRQPAGVLRGHLTEIDGLALAPDGRTLASRCKDGSIYLWDVTKPSRHIGYRILPKRWDGGHIDFTADSRSILQVPYRGGELVLWDALTSKETRRSWTTSTNGHVISVSPDASRVVKEASTISTATFGYGTRVVDWKATNSLRMVITLPWIFRRTGRSLPQLGLTGRILWLRPGTLIPGSGRIPSSPHWLAPTISRMEPSSQTFS